jgi:hypothetical protein
VEAIAAKADLLVDRAGGAWSPGFSRQTA